MLNEVFVDEFADSLEKLRITFSHKKSAMTFG